MAQIVANVLPTGGVIAFQISAGASGDWTLARATSGQAGLSPWTVIASGTNDAPGDFVAVDIGDGLPSPLLPTTGYSYLYTDPSGTAQTPVLTPVASVDLQQDDMTRIIIRLLQGMFNALTLPPGINRPKVGHAMPLVGLPPMPFVVVYPELIQQGEVPIGVDVIQPDQQNVWENHEIARRVYRVTVFTRNDVEREFLRDAILACFRGSLAYFLSLVGQDLTQRWQAACYQKADEGKQMLPGFYGCDILLEFSGVYSIAFTTSYGVINEITTGTEIEVQVPLASG